MKNRPKLGAVGLGAAMVLGSMVAFPSVANAAPGDLSVTGTVRIVADLPVSASGAGTLPTATSWTSTGSVGGGGTGGCISLTGLTFDDSISWVDNPAPAADPAVQTLSNFEVTFDSTSCPFDQGVCVVSLIGAQVLNSPDFALLGSPARRTGTFDSTSAPIGGFQLADASAASCTPALAAVLRTGFADNSGNSGTGLGNATVSLSAELTKTLLLP